MVRLRRSHAGEEQQGSTRYLDGRGVGQVDRRIALGSMNDLDVFGHVCLPSVAVGYGVNMMPPQAVSSPAPGSAPRMDTLSDIIALNQYHTTLAHAK